MFTLPEYILKLTISLAVLYLFYRVVLARLTFYQWNRVYLLSYSLLAFILPFIDISHWITKYESINVQLNGIPRITSYPFTGDASDNDTSFSQWTSLITITGMAIMLLRVLIKYFSLRKIKKNAVLWQVHNNAKIFNTESPISPFSFGNDIYFNGNLHSEEELERIIQHEMVHVKQKHTLDLLIGEFLCVTNWYNPFAWWIRKAIRQNLEFIADKNVLNKGHDKKEYQYLLLKVTDTPQYSITNNFNLSDLKKRIMMMNKMKSASLHLTRFLFALPLLAVVLLAFRNENSTVVIQHPLIAGQPSGSDTIPRKAEEAIFHKPAPVTSKPNRKGYRLSIADNDGEQLIVIKDPNNKIVKAVTLADWNYNKKQNEDIYGTLPVIPATTFTPPVGKTITVAFTKKPDPLIIVDGVEQLQGFNMSIIPASNIKSINVLKDDAADKYGEKGANGIIEVHTLSPLVIVEGVEQPYPASAIENIKPASIESVKVLKDKEAIEHSGERGANGVIIIKLKNTP